MGITFPPRSRHRCARRQRGVTRIVTARAVNFAGYQMVIYKFRLDLYGRMAILPNHHRAITKHIAAVAGRMAIRPFRQLIYFDTSLCTMQSGILELSAKRVLAV